MVDFGPAMDGSAIGVVPGGCTYVRRSVDSRRNETKIEDWKTLDTMVRDGDEVY